jgi:FAD synthase
LHRKMDAVKCMVIKAEEYSLEFHKENRAESNFTYYSSKLSLVRILTLNLLHFLTFNLLFRRSTEKT